MATETNLTNLYDSLMAISREAFAGGLYEVAFHALQSALHSAEALKDQQCLTAVHDEAERQRVLIDKLEPNHRMSTQSAALRGRTNMYRILARQAQVHINQVSYEERRQQLGPLPDFWQG